MATVLQQAGLSPKQMRRMALYYVQGVYVAEWEKLGKPLWFAVLFERKTPAVRGEDGFLTRGAAQYSTLAFTAPTAEEAKCGLASYLGGHVAGIRKQMVLVHYDGGARFRVYLNGKEVTA